MDWKKIGKALLFPPVWVMAVLTLLSAAALGAVFWKGWENTPPAYGVYVLSFYTLSVVCVYGALVLPKRFKAIRQKIYDIPLGERYMTDKAFRAKVSVNLSLTVNLLYVGVNLLSWYLQRSWWFVILALYYAILSAVRLLLAGYVRKNDIGESLEAEWRRSRLCACILLLLNLFLSGAVLMILYRGRGYDYPGIMIYVMAAYTFYITTAAIVNMVKYRKLGSPVVTTTKVISLCAALVSMLNLETAMFSQFGGEMSPRNQRIMIAATGAGVSVIVVALSLAVIIHAMREIRRYRDGKQG